LRELSIEEDSTKVPDVSIVEASAEQLYGLIHQRFIVTRQGLQQMVRPSPSHLLQCKATRDNTTTTAAGTITSNSIKNIPYGHQGTEQNDADIQRPAKSDNDRGQLKTLKTTKRRQLQKSTTVQPPEATKRRQSQTEQRTQCHSGVLSSLQ
jgi:hypothetical protein